MIQEKKIEILEKEKKKEIERMTLENQKIMKKIESINEK